MGLNTVSGRFRFAAIAEGISCVLLFFVAMPLKYGLNIPGPVKIIGLTHGILFLLYLLAATESAIRLRWSLGRVALAYVASVVPCATFVFEAYLRRQEQSTH